MNTTQLPTDADLARAWGAREGYKAFVDLDVPMTSEQIFQAVTERWQEETGEATRLSTKLNVAQSAAIGVLAALLREGIARNIEAIPTRYGSGTRRDVNRVIGTAADIARGENQQGQPDPFWL